ncbi:helix-turn-helix domain-containing protein [Streptomyces roseirectus]|uniref:Helix-turn-helix domain-containing protein n=1 Tax=Streptomyces roseirectus TaxID=2768066 RepID=A0A7H0IF43_9ACTN|nr:helix-turn-helix transcriptional regulator [Streptomyces roseirectus]QNP71409.1 helix-turn-helix domain-containing protein [Streptomyces roseirectus]
MNRKELNPDASPQAEFGAFFRSVREEQGWRQEDLSEPMGYSGSHISAVETGRKWPTLRFARSADTTLGTGDRFEQKWREIKHGVLLEGFPEYVMYEGKAIEVRLYDIGVIPGLLQTPDYARVLANSAVQRGAVTQQQADERVSFLLRRQKTLFQRSRPPMMFVVMDESCIRRPIGGPEVMAAQLDHLIEFAANPRTMLQIAPFEMGERRSLYLPVNLITMPDRTMVYYAESQAQGNFDRESPAVAAALTAYHQLQAEALSQAESVAMIRQVRKGTP